MLTRVQPQPGPRFAYQSSQNVIDSRLTRVRHLGLLTYPRPVSHTREYCALVDVRPPPHPPLFFLRCPFIVARPLTAVGRVRVQILSKGGRQESRKGVLDGMQTLFCETVGPPYTISTDVYLLYCVRGGEYPGKCEPLLTYP